MLYIAVDKQISRHKWMLKLPLETSEKYASYDQPLYFWSMGGRPVRQSWCCDVQHRESILTLSPSKVKAERRVLLRFNFLRFFIAKRTHRQTLSDINTKQDIFNVQLCTICAVGIATCTVVKCKKFSCSSTQTTLTRMRDHLALVKCNKSYEWLRLRPRLSWSSLHVII